MRKYTYYIPGTPISKKNSQRMVTNPRTGKMFPVPSKAYKEYESAASYFLQEKPQKPIDYPVNVACVYTFPRNKDGSIPKVKRDLTNLLEATDDILVKYKILADDDCKIVCSHDNSRVLYISDCEPSTQVTITEVENDG